MSAEQHAADAVLAAILPSYPLDTDLAEVPALRDRARHGLADALRVLARASATGSAYELRMWAEQLDTRCPDCGRHLTRDPWRHCATCEPETNPGVQP
jgi:hypothetical protein